MDIGNGGWNVELKKKKLDIPGYGILLFFKL
jgi:hypothetical protein